LKHVFNPYLVGLNEWIGWDKNLNYVTCDESILILISFINICNYVLLLCWNSEFFCQPSLVLLLCSSRNWSFGRKYWSLGDDLVHFHILYFICFSLMRYDLYQPCTKFDPWLIQMKALWKLEFLHQSLAHNIVVASIIECN